MKKSKDLFNLWNILISIEKIEEYTTNISLTDFLSNEILMDACAKRLENLCEASINLSNELKQENPLVPWSDMAGMRIILAHKYFAIDSGILWDTIKNQLPGLKEIILNLIQKIEEKSS